MRKKAFVFRLCLAAATSLMAEAARKGSIKTANASTACQLSPYHQCLDPPQHVFESHLLSGCLVPQKLCAGTVWVRRAGGKEERQEAQANVTSNAKNPGQSHPENQVMPLAE